MPNLQDWMEVLAKMEADADAACRLDVGSNIPASQAPEAGEPFTATYWTPPANLGPLPGELLERARIVEAAQQAAVERLEEAKALTARHLTAVQSIPEGRTSGKPVFLDVTG